eukprot:9120392-Lingulodinium_polyedra.AAC.1
MRSASPLVCADPMAPPANRRRMWVAALTDRSAGASRHSTPFPESRRWVWASCCNHRRNWSGRRSRQATR